MHCCCWSVTLPPPLLLLLLPEFCACVWHVRCACVCCMCGYGMCAVHASPGMFLYKFVQFIVPFIQIKARHCSGCGFAAMECWWDDGCYPCSYCGNQYGATHFAWLCVDVWYLRPQADLDWDLEAWEPERVHFPPYELFSNLHVVWNDRYWPCSRKWLSKCDRCAGVTRRDFRLCPHFLWYHPF